MKLKKPINDKCPNCKKKLEKIPSRKKKCKFCGKYMYVRTRPQDRNRVLVTEKESKKIDAQNDGLQHLSMWGITPEYVEEVRKDLTKKFKREAPYSDAIWSIFNELILKVGKEGGNLGSLYYSMALFLHREEKDPILMLQQSAKYKLMEFKKHCSRYRVKILGVGGCIHCQKANDKTYTIDEALQKMPLPVKKCNYQLFNGKHGFCRCIWGIDIS